MPNAFQSLGDDSYLSSTKFHNFIKGGVSIDSVLEGTHRPYFGIPCLLEGHFSEFRPAKNPEKFMVYSFKMLVVYSLKIQKSSLIVGGFQNVELRAPVPSRTLHLSPSLFRYGPQFSHNVVVIAAGPSKCKLVP